ncbi:hypothetical protein BVZ65_00113B, partial [Haemophilus influenzae]
SKIVFSHKIITQK